MSKKGHSNADDKFVNKYRDNKFFENQKYLRAKWHDRKQNKIELETKKLTQELEKQSGEEEKE